MSESVYILVRTEGEFDYSEQIMGVYASLEDANAAARAEKDFNRHGVEYTAIHAPVGSRWDSKGWSDILIHVNRIES